MRSDCLVLLLAACTFDSSGLGPSDAGGGADASPGDGVRNDALGSAGPVHVPDDGQYPGGPDVTLTGSVTITTGPGGPVIDTMPNLEVGVVFDVWMQPCAQVSCPEVAVLHTGAFTVADGALVRVVGTRPLVIVAGGKVTIAGRLDAGGRAALPGASGFPASMGPGAGGTGQANSGNDGGGGGAGFGKRGGNGGDGANGSMRGSGGAAGLVVDQPELLLLQGGAGGGAGSPGACSGPAPGGAGGGAIELFSTVGVQITIAGVIQAGGGGGTGGSPCSADNSAGGGAGAGGAIVLQAPSVDVLGTLAANGGAGGGGASAANGGNGQDALAALTAAAPGASGGMFGAAGGSGGFGATNAVDGGNGQSNGGGGGGAVGRIRILHRMPLTAGGTITPDASAGTY